MNLKTYGRQEANQRLVTDPGISYSRHGIWLLNRTLCEHMGLKHGDHVCLHQDTDNPADWYIAKDAAGIPVRRHTTGGALIFNSMVLRRAMMEAIGEAPESGRMLVADEPVVEGKQRLWPIITNSISNHGRGRKRA